jgi:hypothetical protein
VHNSKPSSLTNDHPERILTFFANFKKKIPSKRMNKHHFLEHNYLLLKFSFLYEDMQDEVIESVANGFVPKPFQLSPKGLRGVFSKKHSKTAVSSSRSPTDFFFIFWNF